MKTRGIPQDIDKQIGLKIRQIRLAKSMTQSQIAEAFDVTFQQVQKYERGVNRISAGKLYQFSKFVAVDINFFFTDTPCNETVEGSNGFLHDFAKLSSKQRTAVATMTKELSNA